MNIHRTLAFHALLALLLCCPAQAQPGAAQYTIPVVFHVLHQNGTENISDEQIADAMEILNTNFDAPTWTVEPPFDAIAADMDIAFVLASVAPDGSPTNGIDRIETPLTIDAGAPSSYVNAWPRNRYLNIWTVRSLAAPGISYISQLPNQVDQEPCTDGIMIFHSYVGSIGTASQGTKRTLTQAVGRFLNLKMVYEDPIGSGPCADDEVTDTPPCVATVLCNGITNSCDAVVANEHNFMSSPYCSNMFTAGQRARVHACLTNSVAQRNELASGITTITPDCLPSSITDPNGTSRIITAFPIPFVDRIHVSGLSEGLYQAELLDHTGRIVISSLTLTTGAPLEVGVTIASGVYLLKLHSGSRTHIVRVVRE
ncbi:MAG: zinc-dependent metalloprotease [Flavobacteriales bacterium]|nr:zinc-dependent metalloprotease [Flavobacteriales bacterium]